MPSFDPPFSSLDDFDADLKRRGYALLAPDDVMAWLDAQPHQTSSLHSAWSRLPPDAYLKDGGRYRRRRHSCFIVEGALVSQVPHRAHWQPLAYNALHGGMQRWFEPMEEDSRGAPLWERLLARMAEVATALRGAHRWHVEAHLFRIDTTDGIGRPTPEGAHRDGVDLVAVLMLGRQAIKGGESRVFEADGPNGQRFTLGEPWSLLLLDDERVIHETTPIQPLVPGELGWRDTLVLTLRRDSFQGD